MWTQVPTDELKKQLNRWPNKHKRELGAMLANLKTVYLALRSGASVESLQFGFVHTEPGGVLALDQKGGGAGLKQTRLYVYPQKSAQVVHVITIGDKASQSADVAYAKAFVDGVKADEEGE